MDFTKWTRQDFGDQFGIPPHRAQAETETNQDLQKPIQQLVCDVREQAQMPLSPEDRQVWMTVRMVAMMGRVALEHERISKKLMWLTIWLIVLTVVLIAQTAALIWLDLLHRG